MNNTDRVPQYVKTVRPSQKFGGGIEIVLGMPVRVGLGTPGRGAGDADPERAPGWGSGGVPGTISPAVSTQHLQLRK